MLILRSFCALVDQPLVVILYPCLLCILLCRYAFTYLLLFFFRNDKDLEFELGLEATSMQHHNKLFSVGITHWKRTCPKFLVPQIAHRFLCMQVTTDFYKCWASRGYSCSFIVLCTWVHASVHTWAQYNGRNFYLTGSHMTLQNIEFKSLSLGTH